MIVRTVAAAGIALTAALVLLTTSASGQRLAPLPDYCSSGAAADLPLPSALPLDDYEQQLYAFLFERAYTELRWCVDREVRDTGPFLLEDNYGTHPAVRIFYSPGVMTWLRNGRQGEIPDGAMIIKEMFPSPAARYQELRDGLAAGSETQFETALQGMLEAWTVLVKDKSVSKDGWFWANPAPGSGPHSYSAPFNFPASGAGSSRPASFTATATRRTTA
jgi:hypothetical protein